MTINDLELFLVERQSDTTDPSIRSLLIRLVTESGLEGWGEAVLPWRSLWEEPWTNRFKNSSKEPIGSPRAI